MMRHDGMFGDLDIILDASRHERKYACMIGESVAALIPAMMGLSTDWQAQAVEHGHVWDGGRRLSSRRYMYSCVLDAIWANFFMYGMGIGGRIDGCQKHDRWTK